MMKGDLVSYKINGYLVAPRYARGIIMAIFREEALVSWNHHETGWYLQKNLIPIYDPNDILKEILK